MSSDSLRTVLRQNWTSLCLQPLLMVLFVVIPGERLTPSFFGRICRGPAVRRRATFSQNSNAHKQSPVFFLVQLTPSVQRPVYPRMCCKTRYDQTAGIDVLAVPVDSRLRRCVLPIVPRPVMPMREAISNFHLPDYAISSSANEAAPSS